MTFSRSPFGKRLSFTVSHPADHVTERSLRVGQCDSAHVECPFFGHALHDAFVGVRAGTVTVVVVVVVTVSVFVAGTVTVVVATHDVHLIEQFGARRIVLGDGRVADTGERAAASPP